MNNDWIIENDLMAIFLDCLTRLDFKKFKNILYNSSKVNINFEDVMTFLIKFLVKDEELFNLLYLKKGFIIPFKYLYKEYISIIENNIGLIRTIARRGLITKNKQGQMVHYREPVHYLLKTNRLTLAEKILDVGISIDQPDNQGMTAIFLCIKLNNIQFFEKVLYKYNPDLSKKNIEGQTPFVYLLQSKELNKKNREEFFKIITSYKDSRYAFSANIDDTVHIEELLIQFIHKRNYDLIKKVLVKHPLLSGQFLLNGKTVMSNLIDRIIDDEETYNILFKQRAFIDQQYIRKYERDEIATEPIFLIERNIGLIKSIIKNGFYTKNKNGEVVHISTPVIYFIKNTKTHLVEILLENGASVEERDEIEYSPLFNTITTKNFSLFKTILYKYHPKLVYEVYHNKIYSRLKVCQPITVVNLTSKSNIASRFEHEIKAYIELMKDEPVEISNLPLLSNNGKSKDMINVFKFTKQDYKLNKTDKHISNNDVYHIDNNKDSKNDNSSVSTTPLQSNESKKEEKRSLRKIKSEFGLRTNRSNIEDNGEKDKLKPILSDDEEEKEKERNNNDDNSNNKTEIGLAVSKSKSNITKKEGGPEDSTPLLSSIKYGKCKSVETLLSFNPDLTIPDKNKDTPFSFLLKNFHLPYASKLLTLLIPKLSLHQTYGPDNLTPLYYCLKYQNKQGLEQLSHHKDFNVEELDKENNTPLLYLIKNYLNNRTQPFTEKQEIPTPEHIPTSKSTITTKSTTPLSFIDFELISSLLSLGANTNYEHPLEHKVPLIYAIEKDQLDLIELLMFHHANPYYKLPNHLTPLKLTIKRNNVTIAKILLDTKYINN
ncbi:hypothetical protein PIROE2DRAFT_56956 [Piromyces sp. E2]|nr:hypothetical protein PIROE2DRAFT_56956 [Piromyces sp. E2]|eukprot:OUM70294.1 hypothetical protein PIROE2DRAFT_56956 [Piromyces sp. E2]